MKSFILHFRQLLLPEEKRQFVFITLLMALSALLELAGLGILAGAAAMFLAPGTAPDLRIIKIIGGVFPGVDKDQYIAWLVMGIGILLVLKNIFALLIVDIQTKFVFNKRNELSRRLMKSFLYADYRKFSGLASDFCFGSIQRVSGVSDFLFLPLMQFFADILVIAVLSIAAVILFPAVTLSGITFMAAAAAAVYWSTSCINRRYGKEKLALEQEENKWRQNGIFGAKTIKTSAKEAFFLDRFSESCVRMNFFNRKLYTLGQLPRLSLESASILLACTVFAVMLLSGVSKPRILLTFAVLTAVIGRILPALSRCNYNLTLIKQNYPLLESILSLLNALPAEPAAGGPPANAAKDLEIKDLTFAYDGRPILKNFNLSIPAGSSLAVSGKSGRGKSTLIDLILGLLTPQQGTICAGGIPIRNDLAAWRTQIGAVPQTIFMTEGTIRENVAFGEVPENIDDEKVQHALALAGLKDFSPDHPISSAGNLSGGQRQRIGIARALYRDAKLLILDEATSALDSENENAFCEVIRNLRGKKTVIVISHRESTLSICDRKLEL